MLFVRGAKKGIFAVIQNDNTAPPPVTAPQFTEADQKAFADLFLKAKQVRTPPTQPSVAQPPTWKPAAAGESPYDQFQADKIPLKLRTPNLPQQLVGIIEPDPVRGLFDELGAYTTGSTFGNVLDVRGIGIQQSVMIAKNGSIIFWEKVGTSKPETPMVNISYAGTSARFSHANHDMVAVATDGQSVRLFETVDLFVDDPTGTHLADLDNPASKYVQLELVDRDRLIVLRSANGRIRNARFTGEYSVAISDPGAEESADDIAASSDGLMLAAVSSSRKTLTTIEYEEGNTVRTRTMKLPFAPVRAAVHPGKQQVALTDDRNAIYVMDLNTARSTFSFVSNHPPLRIEFASDGRHLLHYDVSGKVAIFRLPSLPSDGK